MPSEATTKTNLYGDDLSVSNSNRGADIASQRQDDLDKAALELAKELGTAQVVDLGCGHCAMSNAFHELGAHVVAVDLQDYSAFASPGVTYLKGNLLQFLERQPSFYDIIFCQRTLHYLSYSQAKVFLQFVAKQLSPRGHLFLSASGLHSELGNGYEDADKPLDVRFSRLSAQMAEKHGIKEPVCLYSKTDLEELVKGAGLVLQDSWTSDFGNVKLIASVR